MNKFSKSRLSRNDFLMNGGGGGQIDFNHSSRQIYLTFPADSIFREEDVSNYFRIYGPVQDVRIPYQQKMMFGFVTFVYSDTVKIILAKGNPHFVCDSRVLVMPYKDKGKIPDKYRKQQHQLQQMERGDFSACNPPTALDPRDPFENQLGSRMLYNNSEEAPWGRKLEEQADLQQALELHSKRLMNLELNMKRSQHNRALSAGAAPFPSPVKAPSFNQALTVTDCTSPNGGGQIDFNHSSRKIYLTFPADSIFREEDVSNYFSIYGPVQDVRIHYQQKWMFGFVTFVYSDTVKIILAKGNPHFVCDSRVLVKPYKEKARSLTSTGSNNISCNKWKGVISLLATLLLHLTLETHLKTSSDLECCTITLKRRYRGGS